MSATPLIEIENITKHYVRKEKYITYALIETAFQNWTAKLEAEWRTNTGELSRYWLKVQNPSDEKGRRYGEVDGKSKELFGKITSFEMSFSGFGRMELEDARRHMDTMNVTLAIAEELERRLNTTGFPMPEVDEFDVTKKLIEPKNEE